MRSTFLAVAAGFAMLLAFPPYDLWWLAPVAVALLALAVHERRARNGALLGLLSGWCFFVPLLSFTGLQVGWGPWLLLAAAQAVFFGALGGAGAAMSAVVNRRLWLWPLITGLWWVTQEALRSRVPFGGFPWGRLAFSQAEAPVLSVAALGGAPLVTFAVATAGGLFALALRVAGWPGLVALAGAAGLMLLPGLTPAVASQGREVTVAVIQGNVPRLGLDFNAQRRAVLDNHVEATLQLARDVARGVAARPDVIVWPENSSDIDPLWDPVAADRIDVAARAAGVPILIGAVLQGPRPGTVRNAAMVWTPGQGAGQTYVKRHPVPFAEYVPMRSLVRRVTTLVDRVRTDFIAGTEPGVLDVGGTRIGTVICFEVAYDGLVRDNATRGAEILAVQTNNATFNNAEATQQLAMVRLRSVEHGRPALMASTVGVSAFAGPDGSVHQATDFNTQAVIVRRLQTSGTPTWATRLGDIPELALTAAAVLIAAISLSPKMLRRSRVGEG